MALRNFMAAMWSTKGSTVSPQALFSAIAKKYGFFDLQQK